MAYTKPPYPQEEARFSGVVRTPTSRKQSSRSQSTVSPGNSTNGAVLGALSNLTNSLDRLVDRLEKQESRLAAIEDRLSSAQSSSSSPCGSQKKAKVPLPIRVC